MYFASNCSKKQILRKRPSQKKIAQNIIWQDTDPTPQPLSPTVGRGAFLSPPHCWGGLGWGLFQILFGTKNF